MQSRVESPTLHCWHPLMKYVAGHRDLGNAGAATCTAQYCRLSHTYKL